MKKIIVVLVAGTLLLGLSDGCAKKEPSDSKAPEPKPAAPSPPKEASAAVQNELQVEKAAIDAAEAWLKLLDEGQYAESWSDAAENLKNALPQESWQQSMESVRSPLGSLISRNLKWAQNRTTLSHLWYAALGKMTGEGKEDIRNYCKWHYGMEILAETDKAFAGFYHHMINTYTYEQCVKAMQWTQVTSLMNVKQMAEYLNHVDQYAIERGYQLPQPQDIYYEAMGYDEPTDASE